MIRTEHLKKHFGNVVAVEDVSFSAADGTVTGLLGPNGAGKTTSLRMMYGLVKPDAGTIQIDGHDAVANPLAAQACLGVLPDQSGLYPRLTPREHIRYFANLQGVPDGELGRAHAELAGGAGFESCGRSAGRRFLTWRADESGFGAGVDPQSAEYFAR